MTLNETRELKCKCGADLSYMDCIKNQTHTGLYCLSCGLWQKWLTKREVVVIEAEIERMKLERQNEPSCCKCSGEGLLMSRSVYEECFSDYVSIELAVVLDGRGYLRHVDVDDRSCFDHGEKVKIKFCPFCGREFKN